MLGVTLFGLFLTPVFYVTLRKFVTRKVEREVLPPSTVADNKKPPSQ
jgi:multidrug efflux pump